MSDDRRTDIRRGSFYRREVLTISRLFIPLVVAPIALGALTACGNDSGEPTAVGAAPSPAVATPTTVTPTSTPSGTMEASPTSATSTRRAAVGIDSVQVRLNSYAEVSPGVLQGEYAISADIEWMAVSAGAAYDGERCAAVITLTGPGGHILETDRQSTCSGTTYLRLEQSKVGTGTFIVSARLAPWEDAQNPTDATLEFDVIAAGT